MAEFSGDRAAEVPVAGDDLGALLRGQFVSDISRIVGQGDAVEMLWLPAAGDAATSITADRNQRTITWNESVAGKLVAQGSGLGQTFDGTTDEGDIPENDDLRFGDGVRDFPFSCVAVGRWEALSGHPIQNYMAKSRTITGTNVEWQFYHGSTTNSVSSLSVEIRDASTGARIRCLATDVLTNGAVEVVGMSYNGTGSSFGINLYHNGTRKDDFNLDDGGTYTAMEDTDSNFHIGARDHSKREWFNGTLYMGLVASRLLSPDEMWAIKELCNGFFGIDV